jgi:membrane protein
MSRKEAVKKKLKFVIKTAQTSVKKIYHGEEIAGGAWNKTINAAKVFIVSTRKFILDDCMTKASSITYTIILSLVPALTVGLTIYSLYYGVGQNKKELFDRILLFMTEHNIKLNIDPIFDAILGLVENAGKIGGISAAVMIFSATAMLRTMEKSMNDIWKIKQGRPIILKIIYYWAALTLGPIMLAAGMTVATQLSTILSSPNFNAAAITDNRHLWVVGDKSRIQDTDTGVIDFKALNTESGKIDFDNQKIYSYESGDRTLTEKEGRVEPLELKKVRFRSIQFIGRKGWIAGTDGIILSTGNGGTSWQIRKFGTFNFNAIRMISETRGFIAAESGFVLTTIDGGENWSVEEYQDQPNFSAIAFFKDRGIITGSRGIILRTEDGGRKWELQQITAAKRLNRLVNINNAFFVNENQVWLLGSDGMLLLSDDGGKKWMPKKFKEHDYYSALFFNPDEGVVGGDDGTVIRTVNGGDSWESKKLPTLQVNSFLYRDGRLWAIGDAGTIMVSKDRGVKWEIVIKGKKFGYTIINFLAPFAFIWLLFLLTYITLPNTRIPFKPAALGASFTGAVWVIFILLFIVYVKAFAQGTFAVYGALAAIPLFLLMVYASSLIILYGAEVAYTLMHPETYQSLKKTFRGRDELHVYYGIALIQHIYREFESGNGASSLKELQKSITGRSEEIDIYLRLFLDEKLIIQDSDGDYLPANSSENIGMNKIIDTILHISLDMPVQAGKSSFRIFLGKLFNQITANRRKVIGNLTLKDLMDKE